MNYADQQAKYVRQILQDLKLDQGSQEERTRVLEMLNERFQRVIFLTLVKNLDAPQRERLLALIKVKPLDEKALSALAVEAPGLDRQIELALAEEYKSLKSIMAG